jgi:hypothetical protein
MNGLPVLVREEDWPAIVAAGHTPAYRAINGAFAARRAQQFHTGLPYVGSAEFGNLRGSGTNFATDHEVAGRFTGSGPTRSFTSRRCSSDSAMLMG